ncbi:MAG: HAMP domain-containing methyl-accepting chemotaxis protein [Gallionella sp.]|jgi:methyl-accepting chemotaxis protein
MNIKTKLRVLGLVCFIGLGIILIVTIVGLNSMREAEETAHRRQSYAIDLVEIKASALSSIMLDPSSQETKDVFSDAEKNIDIHGPAAVKVIKRDNIKEELKVILAQWSHYDQESQAIIKLAGTDLKGANEKLVPLYNNEFKPFQAALEKFVAARQKEAEQGKKQADSVANNTFWTIVVLIGIVTAVIVVVVLNISRSLQTSLQGILQKLDLLKQGDLTERLPTHTKDELGEIAGGVNTFIQELQHIVQRTREQSDGVTDAALHLASASAQVLSSSNHQSEATSSVSAAIEQLSVSIDQVSNSASAAEKTASLSGQRSREGGIEVADAVNEIKRIEHAVNEASNQIESLGQRAHEISSIVNAIKEVADQTNLLALNAAIEAARAGEQGRGFAVVADEVRKLAERTAQSAQEITGMIGSIQTEAENSTNIMRKGNELVAQGVKKAELAGGAMHQIDESSASVLSAISDISAVLREQRISSTEIAQNVELIASMTGESTAAVSEVSSAAERLKKLAVELQQGVAQFKV